MAEDIFILPANEIGWRPELFPGGADAQAAGCTCPTTNALFTGTLTFDDACPVHDEVKRRRWRIYLCIQ